MKPLLSILIVAAAMGCNSSKEPAASKATSGDPLIKKLESLPPSEREAYARAHAAEIAAAAQIPTTPTK